MSEKELQAIAEKAKFIVSGYAFSRREDGFIRHMKVKKRICSCVFPIQT